MKLLDRRWYQIIKQTVFTAEEHKIKQEQELVEFYYLTTGILMIDQTPPFNFYNLCIILANENQRTIQISDITFPLKYNYRN
jgi:hypothetical protein